MNRYGEYEGIVIRPPSEADSLIFQVTLGCSDNRCTFCPAYKDKAFRVRDVREVEEEMRDAARLFPEARRIFLADGDAAAAGQEQLEYLLGRAAAFFPRLARVGMYGSVKSLEKKTVEDLRALKALKLGVMYLGFETGDDEVYRDIRKYGSPDGNAGACGKVKAAGITANATIILGLGGKRRSRRHAENTAKLLNRAQPHQVAALTLMTAPGSPLHRMAQEGEFTPLERFGLLEELKLLLENLEDFPCLFFSNHASNYYPVQARFPRRRKEVITALERVIREKREEHLTPDHLRGL
ncbi:MAG: radical SAM protein [Endomicrobiales bacterium]